MGLSGQIEGIFGSATVGPKSLSEDPSPAVLRKDTGKLNADDGATGAIQTWRRLVGEAFACIAPIESGRSWNYRDLGRIPFSIETCIHS